MKLEISLDKPLFPGSTRPLMVRQEGKDIGYLKRWYKNKANQQKSDPKDQVHVSVFAKDYEIEIAENRSSAVRGKEWEIRISGRLTGHLKNNDSLKDPHAVKLDMSTLPEITVEQIDKKRGRILIDGEASGETLTGGRYIPTKYDAVIDHLPEETDPLLVAGMLYVYWFAS